jgi:hypothetical protein
MKNGVGSNLFGHIDVGRNNQRALRRMLQANDAYYSV